MGYEMFAIATATLLVRAAASPDWIGQNFQKLREKTLLEITLPGSHNSGNYQGGLHTDVLLGYIFIPGEEQEASNKKKYHINCKQICPNQGFAKATTDTTNMWQVPVHVCCKHLEGQS